MKVLLLCVVAAVFLFQCEALTCYSCGTPADCLKMTKVDCPANMMCKKGYRDTIDGDGKPQPGDQFGTINQMVWGRGCATPAQCDPKDRSNRMIKVTCCNNEDLCNK